MADVEVAPPDAPPAEEGEEEESRILGVGWDGMRHSVLVSLPLKGYQLIIFQWKKYVCLQFVSCALGSRSCSEPTIQRLQERVEQNFSKREGIPEISTIIQTLLGGKGHWCLQKKF